ncbi:transcription antitermination factor NusB [Edaphobacter bradus]|uniref:transcription antitermination factor NusB n=1 Tax=Edaphobacter bradus TaxID=2259016 RepID=UPI0021DFB269|nr:transcription antitermination factor NusB [Edaphobacter bradus]
MKTRDRQSGNGGAASRRSSGTTQAKPVSPARMAAFEILALVGDNKGNSDDLLHSTHTAKLSGEDRNLATALVLGVLRWQIALDARIQPLLQRPDQRLGEPVAIALRLGAFQLLHLDRIPAHAAINESVELTRGSGNPHAAGMVNAILRKLAATPARGRPIHESAAAIAQRLGHPLWLVERWVATYGRQATLKICEADQVEPAESILFSAEPEAHLPQMDDGSRLVAELAAASAAQATRVWDACAAPGGKTLILAHRLPSASILATDASPRRLERMRARLGQYPYASNIRTEVADATEPAASLGHFDLILCDVPCSGTGTLARNPEIRHRLALPDLKRHAARQRAILRAALDRLAPGGRLLYSTCSLEPEECEQVIAAVAADVPLHTVSIEPVLDRLAASGVLREPLPGAIRNHALRTLPGTHPGDGFFAALLERPAQA